MDIPEPTTFVLAMIAGILFGLLSTPHCFGMCGPLHLAMCLAGKKRSFKSLTLFNVGRIAGYTLIGIACGFFGEQLTGVFNGPQKTPTSQEQSNVKASKPCCKETKAEAAKTEPAEAAKTESAEATPKTITVPKSCCEAAKAKAETAKTDTETAKETIVTVPKSCCEAAATTPPPAEPKLGLGKTARRMLMFIFPAIILLAVGIKGLLKRPAAVGAGGDGWLTRLFNKFQSGGPLVCGAGAALIPCGMLYVAFAIAVSTISAFLGGVFMLFYCLTITFFMQLGIMAGTKFGKTLGAKVDKIFPWLAFAGAAVYLCLFFWKG